MGTGRESSSSIWPFLPPLGNPESGGVPEWPSKACFALKSVVRGPKQSEVSSGEDLGDLIADLRSILALPSLPSNRLLGLALFFNEITTNAKSMDFFETVLPAMASLLLRLPDLLKKNSSKFTAGNLKADSEEDVVLGNLPNVSLNLRILYPQQPGLVVITQELAAALLACAFFCLFPSNLREDTALPHINFDHLFGSIAGRNHTQIQKMECLIHYFSRVSRKVPEGIISYERKVLASPDKGLPHFLSSELEEDHLLTSKASLCPFKVYETGTIEDQTFEALEVDFANCFLGGGVLFHGCVQEEIRFLICPELLVGMLFLPSMDKNEAIEIIGSERFSSYTGYASSFTFGGDYIDCKDRDTWGRLRTRIVAIDALQSPSKRQYFVPLMLREINKAYCGFLEHPIVGRYSEAMDELYGLNSKQGNMEHVQVGADPINEQKNGEDASASTSCLEEGSRNAVPRVDTIIRDSVGIATGNWGCGAFSGDFELKSLLQWIAASKAKRPFLHYYTFGSPGGGDLRKIVDWISKEEWYVGELWSILMEYGNKRKQGNVREGLFEWILPQLAP